MQMAPRDRTKSAAAAAPVDKGDAKCSVAGLHRTQPANHYGGAERTFSCCCLDESVVVVRSAHEGSIGQQDLIRTPGAREEVLFAVPLLRNGPSLSVRKDLLSRGKTQLWVPGRVRRGLYIVHVRDVTHGHHLHM